MNSEKEIKIGEVLKLLREEKDLTQDDLARILNVKRQTYSAWERNVSSPGIDTVVFLANFYEVSTDFMLGKTSIRTPIETIAAHHDGDEWTEEELEDIEKFKEFVRMRRNKDKK